MSLLNNAVDSIKVGVEDFEEGSRERLTSSVRNIHAGILLLYKEALKRLSPDDSNDVLIKRKIVPTRNKDDIVKFIGQGKTTVNVYQIRNRFDKLDIETNWEQFESISKIRNDIEHYYTEDDHSRIQHLIAKSFTIISSFIENELKENPVDLLGHITWSAMLEVAELYQNEREKCLNKINKISWGSDVLTEGVQDITCVFCDSDLLFPNSSDIQDLIFECKSCGAKEEAQGIIPRAVQTALGFEHYKSYVDGLEYPYGSCPECGLESYVIKEERCAFCGYEAEHFCDNCGNKIPPSEMMLSPLCAYCNNKLK
ncbi:hypothetical protein [Fodinibius sediminis]|uniref:Uncharacterized protein n=1 Tax=Fodinibius sediminis TaxID=1214077 RepID=A0A521FEE9_9BACT|nr:hypothetical protein [Fodinibius sediminis]SMO94578.1 hypothetical protein SAMN06265218_1325 [Fodinibius sediminis]